MADSFWESDPTVIEIKPRKPRRAPVTGWQSQLHTNDKGAILPTVANALVVLANDLPGLLAFDEFRGELLVTRSLSDEDGNTLPGPYPRVWEAADVVLLQAYMQTTWSHRFTRATVEDAMMLTATRAPFHPIHDWLDELRWDGKPRIGLWLVNAFDCDNTPYHSAIGAKFLIAAVRRIRRPGCKFDHMPVLEGPQGIGKSRTLRELFGDAWFSDSIPSDLSSRDAALALLGVWCLEFAEIEHLIRAEVETIKAFLSRPVDRYRPPYGKMYVERPRQGVLIGTTNADDYLRDSTGNRRIWPIKCRTASVDWVRVNRDQLWAEASHREAAGETIWIDDDDVRVAADTAQADRMTDDVWSATVADWLLGKVETRIPDILTNAINVPRERQGRAQDMRVANILRQIGWQRFVARRDGRVVRVWKRIGSDPPDESQMDMTL